MVDLSFIGEVRKNSKGTPMKIIAARKKNDIDIQFLDEHGYILEHQIYQNFKTGQVRNPYYRNICGVGYIGVGKYIGCVLNDKGEAINTPEYSAWRGIIKRCYFENEKDLHKSYYGISTMCEEWKNFQTFGKWYEENFYDIGEGRMHIDKDVLYPGNKVYSPETCIFVPQRINMLFMNKPNKRGLPNGIRKEARGYEAKYNHHGLGTYQTVEEAYKHYSEAKEKNIKEVAEEYKDRIPNRLYEALINYKVLLENDKNYNKQLHKETA